jgi:hypothetical protein
MQKRAIDLFWALRATRIFLVRSRSVRICCSHWRPGAHPGVFSLQQRLLGLLCMDFGVVAVFMLISADDQDRGGLMILVG